MVTRKQIKERVEQIRKYFPDIRIEWAYGQPKLHLSQDGKEGIFRDDLSPRLPTGQLDLWLDGFENGYRYGFEAGDKCGYGEAESSARDKATYENWTNYPTWLIALEINSNEAYYIFWLAITEVVVFDSQLPTREHPDWSQDEYVRFTLADKLRHHYDNLNKGRLPELAQWVLDSVVDWEEIAEEMVEKHKDRKENESAF